MLKIQRIYKEDYPAIQFYIKNGFEIIGLNTISYSNKDGHKNEVRLEMAYILQESIYT